MSGVTAFLRARLAPSPVEGDPAGRGALGLLQTTLIAGIGITVGLTAVTALIYSPLPRRTLFLNGGLLVAFIGLLVVARRGGTRPASVLLLGVIWMHVSASLWWLGGLRAPVLVVFFPLVLLAAMLLGLRASGVTMLLCLASSLAVLVAEASGRLPAGPPPSTLHAWILFVVTLAAIVAIGHLNTADLLRANRSLQRESEERQRTEERLRQSQKLEAVGRLAGGVAHDFNNLLMVITGHGELLRRSLGPDDARARRVEHIMSAAARAARLVRQLIAFSRSQVLEPQVVELEPLVDEAARMLRPLLGDDVVVTARHAAGLGRARIDPGQIEQVLVNLALNARDAMPRGGCLEIVTSNADVGAAGPVPPGRYVRLAVSDTGAGMDARTRARVFEPFFTTKRDGDGLGLAMAWGTVQQSGGHITVDSEPGRGSTFSVYLPRVEGAAAHDPPSAGSVLPPAGGRETILVMEDEGSVRDLARELLGDLGYRVLCAASGEDALALVERHPDPVELLLADVVIPGLACDVVVERLRTRLPELRVLYMSGHSASELACRGVDPAGHDLLPKPFGPDLLARRVREALDRGRDDSPTRMAPRASRS